MKKISIIVHCCGTEDNISKCFKSITEQSYRNLEIIALVNDNTKDFVTDLSKDDKRIKTVNTTQNTLMSYLLGTKKISGEYLSFIECEDYIDRDYFRVLIENSEINNSELIISNIVRFNSSKKYVHGLTFNTNNESYPGKDFFNHYLEQTGKNIRFNILNNKLIKIDLWQKVVKKIEKLKKTSEINPQLVLTTLSLYYSKKTSFCDNAYYYLHEDYKKEKVEDIDNKIIEINNSFNYIEEFLKNEKIINKYKKNIITWKSLYLSKQIDKYNILKSNNKKIASLNYNYEQDEELNNFYKRKENDNSWDNYYELKTDFSEEYLEIKNQIMDPNIKIISFDMFDTLVTRPFFLPHEMFTLLNKLFLEVFDTIKAVDFSIIRRKSEGELRDINHQKGIVEVTLDEIYDYISSNYNLDKNKLNIIKEKELAMEINFCKRRNSGYELYSLAKFMNKKVILTSDIYLPKKTIKKILENTGYIFDEYYISSELLKTKFTGNLYEYIIDREKTNSILHIGDNYQTDYLKAKEYDILSAHLPKSTFVMMGYTGKNVRYCGQLYRHFLSFNHDHIAYEENYGVRCALGMIANYYFDNPFIPFNDNSDFNGDPYFIGYYAVGMQLISMCKWLLSDAKDNNIDSIAFMARDGFLPFEAAKIFKSKIETYKNIELNYTYVSRKALMPLLLKDKSGISLIETYVDYDMLSPRDILEQLKMVITTSEKKEKEINKEFNLDEKFQNINDFNRCLSIIYDKCFDQKKYDDYYKVCKEYFGNEFKGNASTFDIGYSGKPEAIISTLLGKEIRTYFVHTNNSQAYNNTRNCNSKLVTFYDYKPTITGTIREIFLSSMEPSCIGYKYENNEVKPVFKESEKYNNFNKDMINKIHKGALAFINDFSECFKEYIDEIDLNKYYMSIPLEYYYHYTNMEDRLPTKNLIFENNVNNYVELNDYIFQKYNNYSSEYSLGSIPKREISDIDYSLPKSRTKRIIHYIIHDKSKLKDKWSKWTEKKNDPNLLPKSRTKRVIYYLMFDRKAIMQKVFNNDK